jgi:2-keto-myo-inositol isomerase
MKLCLSQSCTMTTPFADDLAAYAGGGCAAIEVWLTKLETHLQTHSVDETLRLIGQNGLTLAAAGMQGGLLLSQGEKRTAHCDHFKRRLDLCERFRIPVLVVAADPVTRVEPQLIGMALESLAEAAKWAAGFGVRIAFEFHGVDSICTSLESAVRIVDAIGEANLGVCLDAFHFFKGPSKESDLSLLTNANLAHVQLCDVSGEFRETMSDSDRIFPGEGDFTLAPILNRLREIDYSSYVSLELLNPVLWQAKPTQVVELGMTALTRLFPPGA